MGNLYGGAGTEDLSDVLAPQDVRRGDVERTFRPLHDRSRIRVRNIVGMDGL